MAKALPLLGASTRLTGPCKPCLLVAVFALLMLGASAGTMASPGLPSSHPRQLQSDPVGDLPTICSIASSMPASWHATLNWGSKCLDGVFLYQGDFTGLSVTIDSEVSGIMLQDFNLTGTLPEAFGDLLTLNTMVVDDNDLNGTLPDTLGQVASLIQFSLANNRFYGPLPPAPDMPPNLLIFSASNNFFTSSLPTDYSTLTSFIELHLDSNLFTNTLPPDWSTMGNLAFLDLSYNGLSGSLPPEWSAMTRLTAFRLTSAGMGGNTAAGMGTVAAAGTCARFQHHHWVPSSCMERPHQLKAAGPVK